MNSRTNTAARAEALFTEWLVQRESGLATDLEDLCRAHPELAEELRELFRFYELFLDCAPRAPAEISHIPPTDMRAEPVDPEISLEPPPPSGHAVPLGARLGDRAFAYSRYTLEDELARGGMGAVLRVWDGDLRRYLAMKVILDREAIYDSAHARAIDATRVARFLEEAQVTGQLDHPGIVPVHELGLDQDGRVFFTMKLVQGRDLKQIFELSSQEEEGWNETRSLGVILKACEAVAYAHRKGVIHRDLKPANVMVGNFGEVYVMDWGLARVLGRADSHDIRIDAGSASARTAAETELRAADSVLSNRPLLTRDGDVVGTPAYMSPEQARGEIERLGPRSDVYSMGAMLYHLLAGRPPYVASVVGDDDRSVLAQVVRGPPEPLGALRKDVPAELVSICEKAMAHESARRYADTLELADDLRAYLEHRVVSAYETGAWAEARKWVARNRPLAASLATALFLLVAGLTASLYFKARADARAVEAEELTRIASEQERLATQRLNDVLSLSAIQELKELAERADALWPVHPDRLPEYERWLADAAVLVDGRAADSARGIDAHPGLADHETKLAEIRRRAKTLTLEKSAQPTELFARSAELERDSLPRDNLGDVYEFENAEDRWWHAQLERLVSDLKAFTDARAGGLDSTGTSPAHGWGVQKRAAFARTLRERSLDGVDAEKNWKAAIAAIARSPKYAGLELAPQIGLYPIGEDPASHLWEFAHLASGEAAQRDERGRLVMTGQTGLVFVLISGGSFWMGAQREDPRGRNFDPQANAEESPVHEVELSPYFLSKYEMTQGQWQRFAGANPSAYQPAAFIGGKPIDFCSPVEQVSWRTCTQVLGWFGLALPTEAQWEHGARAETSTRWWTGDDPRTLQGAANLADAHCMKNGGPANWIYEQWLDDGATVHARVDGLAANPFGLHGVVGNVGEWCVDGFHREFYAESSGSDPAARDAPQGTRVFRGGSFPGDAAIARSAYRGFDAPDALHNNVGVRPARAIDPRAR